MILLLKLEPILGDPKLAAPFWDLRRFFTCYTPTGPEIVFRVSVRLWYPCARYVGSINIFHPIADAWIDLMARIAHAHWSALFSAKQKCGRGHAHDHPPHLNIGSEINSHSREKSLCFCGPGTMTMSARSKRKI